MSGRGQSGRFDQAQEDFTLNGFRIEPSNGAPAAQDLIESCAIACHSPTVGRSTNRARHRPYLCLPRLQRARESCATRVQERTLPHPRCAQDGAPENGGIAGRAPCSHRPRAARGRRQSTVRRAAANLVSPDPALPFALQPSQIVRRSLEPAGRGCCARAYPSCFRSAPPSGIRCVRSAPLRAYRKASSSSGRMSSARFPGRRG